MDLSATLLDTFVVMAVGAILTYLMNDRFKVLRREIDLQREDIADLRQGFGDLRQDFAQLSQEVAGLGQEVAGLRQDFAELRQGLRRAPGRDEGRHLQA